MQKDLYEYNHYVMPAHFKTPAPHIIEKEYNANIELDQYLNSVKTVIGGQETDNLITVVGGYYNRKSIYKSTSTVEDDIREMFFQKNPKKTGGLDKYTESDTESDIESDTNSDTKSDTNSNTKSNIKSNTKFNTESDIESDTESDTKSNTESNTNSDTKSNTESDTNSNTKSNIKSDTNSDTKSNTESDTNSDTDTKAVNIFDYFYN